ncbi:MAG: hypothetical protein H8D23_23585 [Candidatus Brocadiales bacterium]|nr:hypothetical protein [Candidatus Brocadiales bacterium]
MTVTSLITDLKLQIDDTDSVSLLSTDQYTSTISRSLVKVNSILGTSYKTSGDEISPELNENSIELLTVQSLVFIAEMMRAKTAKNFSFKSGDKAVDKTKQPSFWADLHKDYLEKLRSLIKRLAPHLNDESGLLAPGKFPIPEVYEVSSDA